MNNVRISSMWWRLLSLGVVALAAQAQPVLTMSASGSGYPGSTVSINITLSGSAGANIGAIRFDAPAGTAGSFASAPPGAASVAANKSLYAVTSPSGVTTVYIVPFTGPSGPVVPNLPYGDGVVASFSYQFAATAPLGTSVTLALAHAVGITIGMDTVPIGYPTLTITAGIDPGCLALLKTSITGYEATPSKLEMLATSLRVKAAYTTGTCQ